MSSLTNFSLLSTSSSSVEFKFPASPQRLFSSRLQFQAKQLLQLRASLLPAATHEDSGDYEDDWVLKRRRMLISMSTLPVVFSMQEIVDASGVKAEQSDARTYRLIKEQVRKVVSKGKAAGVLRLVFHDAGTFELAANSGGMNGSIIYELERPENAGLKKSLKILEKAKNEVDAIQPVSWADMIAVAGAEAVSICGGPAISVQTGRLDSIGPDAEGKLPQETLDASGLKQCFERKGFSTQELVALSGAHTLGGKGFGNPNVFDNTYYKILLEKPWTSSGGMSSMIGLPSDHALVEDDECLRWIENYADKQNAFFDDFKHAYVKLVNSGARWKRVMQLSEQNVSDREEIAKCQRTLSDVLPQGNSRTLSTCMLSGISFRRTLMPRLSLMQEISLVSFCKWQYKVSRFGFIFGSEQAFKPNYAL